MELIDVPVFESSSDDDFDLLPRIRNPKKIRARIDYFEEYDELEFFTRFRLKKRTCERLLSVIRHRISSQTQRNAAIQPATKLLLTLRFFASGSMLLAVGDFVGISKASACVAVKQVSQAIASLARQYIKMPTSLEEKQTVQEEFYNIAHFPCVIGAIDCTHIRLQSPGGNTAEYYRSDAKLRIRDIVARWPGCTHDQHIFSNSAVKARIESGEMGNSILLGDSGYANTNYLLVPLAEMNPDQPAQNLYNESHICTRNVVERCFGVWKRRFPILSLGMRVSLDSSKTIIVAAAVLHNLAIKENNNLPPTEIDINDEADQPIMQQDVVHNINNNVRRNALIQNHFSNLL